MTATKILIVEDDAALLRGLKDNFRAHGYQVRTANDGEKGLEALLRDPPDLALLDVMLPKVNGYEICRLARSRRLRTAILMLSAKCQEDDVVRGLELGADDYVTKPFGIRELLARAKHLSRRGNIPTPQLPEVPPGLGVRQPSGAFDSTPHEPPAPREEFGVLGQAERDPAFPETANQPAQAKAPSPLRSAGALQDADAPTSPSL
jgi:DNA-binding response OmpR family regulator